MKKNYIVIILLVCLSLVLAKKMDRPVSNVDILLGDTYAKLGDVNLDGSVNTLDYILVKKHILKQSVLEDNQQKLADMNSDNNITSIDYILIKRLILEGEQFISVTGISIDKTNVDISVGQVSVLTVTVSPSNATNQSVVWESSNPNVATIDNGRIVAKSVGKAVITVTTIDEKKVANCTVNVRQKINFREFDIVNSGVKMYLKDVTKISDAYASKCKSVRCDIPNQYSSSIKGNLKIYKYNELDNTKEFVVETSATLINYYLIPNNTYYIESSQTPSKNEYVRVVGNIRMIDVGGINNMRDLGGWQTNSGTVKYGRLFRGAKPDDMKSFGAFNALKINKMVDLRNNDELSKVRSRWLQQIKNIVEENSVYMYSPDDSSNQARKAVRIIMNSIVSDKNVYFNCAGGQDRTGTIAYLIEGILGVKEEYRLEDYELTYFLSWSSGKTRNDGTLKKMIESIRDYDRADDEMSFIKWFILKSQDKNSDIELINQFRTKMINGTPKKYKILNDEVVLSD